MDARARNTVTRIQAALHSAPGFLGLLLYGSRAEGTSLATSDLDLLAIFDRAVTPERLHSSRVDLNLLGIDQLMAVEQRLAVAEGLPWDSMLTCLVVLSDEQGVLTPVADGLNSQRHAAAARVTDLDDLRFLLGRRFSALDDTQDDDHLGGAMHRLAVVALLLACSEAVAGRAWRGTVVALRHLRLDHPELAACLEVAISCNEIPRSERNDKLRFVARTLFAGCGGEWEGEPILLRSSLTIEREAAEALDAAILDRILIAMS